MSGLVEANLKTLGIELPAAPNPVANYVPYLFAGNLLYISGQISKAADGSTVTGQLGAELSVEQGQAAARHCALNIIAQAQAALGSLDRVAQIIKLTGFVNSAPSFHDQPKVINGASDVFVEVFGDKGRHTRAAVGVSALPLNSAVEVDAVILVTPA
jgi:enamine deaminase RidA (YjgF/YER057c/UK114 family)